MQYIPIKTRIMMPPQDDLFSVLDESLIDLEEQDLLLVTSKIVAIHQGLCIPIESVDKRKLVEQEAEHWIEAPAQYKDSPLAIKYGAMFFGAGIDESNSNNTYTLLPHEPFAAAKEIWQYVTKKHHLKELGVIITDSHSLPMRKGVLGISIGLWGFHPVDHHVGKKDLFGRVLQLSSTNIADAVSAGAAAVSGEADEGTPIVIARNVPNVVFTTADIRHEMLIDPKDDIYSTLLKPFFE